MKLSTNFASVVKEAYEYYSTAEYDPYEIIKPGRKFARKMFLLEQQDFTKAVSVYSNKYFKSDVTAKEYLDVMVAYLENPFDMKDARLYCYFPLLPNEFVAGIWKDCSYKKKSAGKERLNQLLNSFWYSKDDYKLVMSSSKKFFDLCDHLVMQRKLLDNQKRVDENYNQLLSL